MAFDLGAPAMGLILLGAFAAGFIDAVVGGGGLITTPTLLLVLPEIPIANVLATTKCASIFGTAGAAASYARSVSLPWLPILFPAMAAALPAAWLGARSISHLDPALVKPAILAVLVLMAGYTWWRPQLGVRMSAGIAENLHPWGAALTGAVIGFYDGFLGPGTGSILVLAFITLFGRDFLQASAAAKFVNGASNLGALLWFAPAGSILPTIALPMAACNLLGGVLGSRTAVLSGNVWIRRVFLAVVCALILRLGWNLWVTEPR